MRFIRMNVGNPEWRQREKPWTSSRIYSLSSFVRREMSDSSSTTTTTRTRTTTTTKAEAAAVRVGRGGRTRHHPMPNTSQGGFHLHHRRGHEKKRHLCVLHLKVPQVVEEEEEEEEEDLLAAVWRRGRTKQRSGIQNSLSSSGWTLRSSKASPQQAPSSTMTPTKSLLVPFQRYPSKLGEARQQRQSTGSRIAARRQISPPTTSLLPNPPLQRQYTTLGTHQLLQPSRRLRMPRSMHQPLPRRQPRIPTRPPSSSWLTQTASSTISTTSRLPSRPASL